MHQRRVLVCQFLQVVRDDHRGHAAPGRGNAHRAVDAVPDLRRLRRGHHVVAGHVLEQRLQVDLLLVVRADRGARLLAHDGDHRHVVHLRVVQPGQQVDCPRSRGRVAQPDLAGELGVRRRHEGGHLLVADLDVRHAGLRPLQRKIEAADAVARIAEHPLQAPLVEAVPDEVADGHAHEALHVGSGLRGLGRPGVRSLRPEQRRVSGANRTTRKGHVTVARTQLTQPAMSEEVR